MSKGDDSMKTTPNQNKCIIPGRYKIHAFVFIVSLSLVFFPNYSNPTPGKWTNAVTGVGCSGIASAITVFILDVYDQHKQKARLIKQRIRFFASLHEELTTLLQQLLWFGPKINDDSFDWSLQPEEYLTREYLSHSNSGYTVAERVSFEKAKSLLNKEYNIESPAKSTPIEIDRMQKVISILSLHTNGLQEDLSTIQDKALSLDIEEIIPMDDSKALVNSIALALAFMNKKSIAPQGIIQILLTETEKIRTLCEFNANLQISLYPNQSYLSDLSKLIS